jgi:hypothetical protein
VKIHRTSKEGFFNFHHRAVNTQLRSRKLLISGTEVSFAFSTFYDKLAILQSSKLTVEGLMNRLAI